MQAETSEISSHSEVAEAEYQEALELVKRTGCASTPYFQIKLGIGYNRAASLIKMMESRGVVGPTQDNTNWHTVLIPTENEAGEIFDGLADERLQSLETLKRHCHPEWRRKIQVCVDSIKYTIAEQNSQIARLKREHEGLLSKLKEIEQALDEYDAQPVPSNETKENC